MPRLTYVMTHGVTAKLLLRGQLCYMRERGFDVTVIASPGPELDLVTEREGVRTIGVSMSRSVRLTEGPRAVWELTKALHAARPDILNASTPKAALLSLVAARTLRIPNRVYLLRGLRLEGFAGVARAVLRGTERLASACAHRIVSVSESLRRVYAELGCAPLEKMTVIPSNGIDVSRFVERARSRDAAHAIRRQHGIPADAIVAGFVGRLVADKGAADMVEAFEAASTQVPNLRLLVVGGDLAGDELPNKVAKRLAANPRIVRTGTVSDPAPHYAAMDLLLFPSYREGLPNVPLEAAACEVPAIGYRSTGVVDAISHNETGVLVEPRNVGALTAELIRYASSYSLRTAHGEAGRRRILAAFTNERTWAQWADLYAGLLATGCAQDS